MGQPSNKKAKRLLLLLIFLTIGTGAAFVLYQLLSPQKPSQPITLQNKPVPEKEPLGTVVEIPETPLPEEDIRPIEMDPIEPAPAPEQHKKVQKNVLIRQKSENSQQK